MAFGIKISNVHRNLFLGYFPIFRVAVSAVPDLNDKGFPLYTFCPDWTDPIHSPGLYEGKVSIEDILDDSTDVHHFITIQESAVNGTWLKSYRLKTVTDNGGAEGILSPCFTHYLPDAERAQDLAKGRIHKPYGQKIRQKLIKIGQNWSNG